MEVKGENYRIYYQPDTATFVFEGVFRPYVTSEYILVDQLMEEVIVTAPQTITIDLHELQYLNSLAILKLSRFASRLQEHGDRAVIVQGSKQIFWQDKSLKHLVVLVPNLKLVWM